MSWDPTDDGRARANRAGKVETLATWCRVLGLTAATVHGWDEVTRRRAARAAGVNPPRAGSPTWPMLVDELAGDPPTAVTDLAMPVHRAWCPGCPTCNPLDTSEPGADVDVPGLHETQHATPGDLPAAPSLVDHQPRGWAQLVAKGPVEPSRPCTVAVPDGGLCGAPAVIRMMTASGRDVWRCAVHPPMAGEWGHRLNLSPTECMAPARCYCGRCDLAAPVPVAAAGV